MDAPLNRGSTVSDLANYSAGVVIGIDPKPLGLLLEFFIAVFERARILITKAWFRREARNFRR
jgi:hypothetical protein